MDHYGRTGAVTFAAVAATALLTLAFRAELWSYLGVAWVVPLIAAPFLAPPCRHHARFLINRSRLYALIGGMAGYALYFPLLLLLTPLLLGGGIQAAFLVSVVAAAALAAWLAVKGCQRHNRSSTISASGQR
jgi:hypothetical protein